MSVDIKDTDRIIVITGFSCTGKTTLSKQLSERYKCEVVSTDDYIEIGFKDSVKVINNIASKATGRLIIEGVQVNRLLRSGLEPDVVITCVANEETRAKRYYDRGKLGHEFQSLKSLDKAMTTVFDEYISNLRSKALSSIISGSRYKEPRFINHETSWL